MGRRCPECRKVWPDHLWTCPRDGAKLGSRLTTPAKARVDRAGEAAKDTAGEAKQAEDSVGGTVGPLPSGCRIGDTLGRYRLIARLAEGGAASVFKAEHTALGREVAIKVLHPELNTRPTLVRRFIHEAKAISRLRHPNIIKITDFEESGEGLPYIVMELLEGNDLRDHIVIQGLLEPEEVVQIVGQICDAMQAAHEADLVHRDLKAENVYLTKARDDSLKVKLLDFGIAKWLIQDDPLLHTQTGEVVGTPEYMAPEQIRGEEVDARTDVYALGVLLYEMLTNQVPFGRDLLGDLLRRQLSETPKTPSDWLKEQGKEPLPPGLDHVILMCLSKRPAARFQSMAALKTALEQSLEDTGTVALRQRARARKARWPWVAAGGVVLVCAAALTAWGILSGRTNKNTRSSTQKAGAQPSANPRTAPAQAPVVLTSQPPKASVFRMADGQFMGVTPLTFERGSTGKERYAVRLRGYHQAEVTVDPGNMGPVKVVLKRARPAADTRPATRPRGLSIKTFPGKHTGRPGQPGKKPPGTVVRKDGEWGVVDPFKTKGKPR